jgi:hypothetical protein
MGDPLKKGDFDNVLIGFGSPLFEGGLGGIIRFAINDRLNMG